MGKETVNALVSDSLQMLPRMTRTLSEAIIQKTAGLPLFVVQFLASLCNEGNLRFSLSTRQWEWDIGAIRALLVADNVVHLMTEKISRLEPKVCGSLRLAACFGEQCYGDLLLLVDRALGNDVGVASYLDVAVSEGLLIKLRLGYRFSHDLIQRAAYLLIPQSERKSFHLWLGRLLWKTASTYELDANLFVVAEQLNCGAELIDVNDEKLLLAQLDLRAGKKAVSMSAFLPALEFFKAGISLVVDKDWENSSGRGLCLDLYNSCAEMEFILGRDDELKAHVGEVLNRSSTLQEKLRAYHVLVQYTGTQESAKDAVTTSLTIIDQLGEALTSTPGKVAVMSEIMKTQTLLPLKIDDVMNLNTMQNADKQQVMKFLLLAARFEFLSGQSAFTPLLVCRMVQLSLRFGVCAESAAGFASYGVTVGAFLRNHDTALRLGKLALAMVDRFPGARESLPWVFSI
eukprot:CAMPEP_0113595486 /NCGR_PEP_ID=MMETSP0015_2-20120614/39736_1 /TAXON_ID=2838 /ORGANISM="Odontella" /LENGTH=457 /DNA_ID=CAMNT_0000502753 /DNA_START=36 /DNA_END=1406 /DNA_ORIENTATION=- /assembly_acc=CAM_ASM_000160